MFEVFVTDKKTGDVKVFETVDSLYLCTAHIDEEKEQVSARHYYFGGGLGSGCAAYQTMTHLPENIKALGREFAERFTPGDYKSDIEMMWQTVRDTFENREDV